MKSVLTTIACILFSSFFIHAQINLSADEWREDLRFLQKTIHQEYSFLFKKTTPEAFDAAVETLHKQIPELASHEIIVGFARLVSSFQYGHTNIWLSAWNPQNPYGFHQMPYQLYYFKDGWYVQGVHQTFKEAIGAKVLKIEGVPIEDVVRAIRTVAPTENDQYLKAYGSHLLGIPEVLHAQGITSELKSSITLSLEKEGKAFDLQFEPTEIKDYPLHYGFVQEKEEWLDARKNSSTPLWLKNLDRIYYYEYLPEQKAVYVRHSQIQDDPSKNIPDFYKEVFEFVEQNEVEKFILDVRLNGGGNNYKNKAIVKGIIETKKINQAGKLFVVLGRRTFSACQNLVNELDNYTEAIFVGEPTGENINFYGDNRPLVLPNSQITPRLSYAWWQDKPQWENDQWLAPQLAVELSFEDYQNNTDPVLEAIWEYNDDSALVDPMQYMTDLFMSGQVAKIKPEAFRLKNDPRYRYYPFENRLNQAGSRLLGNRDFQSAIFVLGLNTELFPESANAYDSLAEAYWKAGQTDAAIPLYEKAIALDPKGDIGRHAKEMLAQIQEEKH